jgi:thiol:disulfide interchange protein
LSRISIVHRHPGVYKVLFYGIPLAFAAVMVILPALPGPVEHPIAMRDGEIVWEKFSTHRLEEALKAKKVVVVDLTGMACALCIINKSVFSNPDVQKILTQEKIVCLRGDLTRMNAKLMMFLRKYGRSAIPFNLVISAQYPNGIVLSENLTTSALLQAIDRVQKEGQ